MTKPLKTFRNPIASIWQYAIHKAISQKTPEGSPDLSADQPEMLQFSTALAALQKNQAIPQKDSAGNVIADCAKLAAEYVWAEITRDTLKASELEDQLRYSNCDPLWTIALAIYLDWKASLDPIPYVRYDSMNDSVIPLPNKPDLAIGIIGDWGTGLDDAKWLLSEVMKKNPDVLIHLGDIYYAREPPMKSVAIFSISSTPPLRIFPFTRCPAIMICIPVAILFTGCFRN